MYAFGLYASRTSWFVHGKNCCLKLSLRQFTPALISTFTGKFEVLWNSHDGQLSFLSVLRQKLNYPAKYRENKKPLPLRKLAAYAYYLLMWTNNSANRNVLYLNKGRILVKLDTRAKLDYRFLGKGFALLPQKQRVFYYSSTFLAAACHLTCTSTKQVIRVVIRPSK